MSLKVLETPDQVIVHVFGMEGAIVTLCREPQDTSETFSGEISIAKKLGKSILPKCTVHVIYVDP